MDKFIRNFLIKAFFAIFFLVIIAVALGIMGCEILDITGTKSQNHKANFEIHRSKLYIYNIYKNEFKDIVKVQHRTDSDENRSFVSTVYMINDSTKFSLFENASSDNDKLKRDIYNDLSFFIQDPKRNVYTRTFYKINKFGWIGIGLFAIAIIWLLNIPKIKKRLIEEKQEEDKKRRIDKLHEERVHGLKNNS